MDSPIKQFFTPRHHLAPLTRQDLLRLVPPALLITVAFALFHFLGSGIYAYSQSHSALRWMMDRWKDNGIAMGSGDYSHGFLVPLASGWVVWRMRDELLQAPKRMSTLGLLGVVGCLFIHYVGYKTQQTRFSLIAMIGLTWTLPFYLYGWQVAKRLIFPCAFLIFAVPLNFLEGFQFPLRKFNAGISASILQGLGIDVKQSGTAIYGPPYDASAKLRLDVADPCSGIRSLTAMMALTAIYGYVLMRGPIRKWLLFAASIPLAMAGNVFRIVSIGILSEAFDSDLAAGLPHDYAGFIVFGMAIALMVVVGNLINLNPLEGYQRWKKRLASARI
jgi:exosortase